MGLPMPPVPLDDEGYRDRIAQEVEREREHQRVRLPEGGGVWGMCSGACVVGDSAVTRSAVNREAWYASVVCGRLGFGTEWDGWDGKRRIANGQLPT